MQSGALIQLPEDLEIEKINKCRYDRVYSEIPLKGVIQFEGPPSRSRDMVFQQAIAMYEKLVPQPVIEEDQGTYRIVSRDTVVATWAAVYITAGLVVVASLEDRSFVRDIINKGLKLQDPSHDVVLNTYKMSIDHPDQWVRGFDKRKGRVQKGTLFGNSVEQDAVFGPELENCSSKTVGWYTDFFGTPTKLRVSPSGSVTLWSMVPPEIFVKFIKKEIMPYVISL